MLKEMTREEYLDKIEVENDNAKGYDELLSEIKILQGIEKNIDFINFLV